MLCLKHAFPQTVRGRNLEYLGSGNRARKENCCVGESSLWLAWNILWICVMISVSRQDGRGKIRIVGVLWVAFKARSFKLGMTIMSIDLYRFLPVSVILLFSGSQQHVGCWSNSDPIWVQTLYDCCIHWQDHVYNAFSDIGMYSWEIIDTFVDSAKTLAFGF